MTILKTQSARRNEKGIALIFTLIMLSLLMILALSFALDSMFEQKAAYNSASSSSSGFMAQAQLKQVLLLMKEGEANFDSDGYLYSLDSGTPTATDKDMLSDDLLVEGVLETGDSCLIKVNWNYVRDADGNIVGRTAFVVVPDDKLPLDSLISSTYDETLDAEPRIGKDVSELNIRPTISSVTNAIINVFNWQEDKPVIGEGFTGGGYLGSWSSYDDLIAAIKAVTTLSTTQEGDIESNLSITAGNDREAFWADWQNLKEIDSDEYFSRFNLTRTDWGTTGFPADLDFIKDEILLDSGATGVPTEYMQTWNSTDTAATKVSGLPWLACFGYTSTGALINKTLLGRFDSVYAQRCQIAANLKDYSDTDDRPTSDVDPKDWALGSSIPDFTGNEETPYINKVGIRIEVSEGTLDLGTSTDYWADIKIHPHVELINIFKDGRADAFLETLKIRIVGKVIVKVSDLESMEMVDNKELAIDQVLELSTGWNATFGKGYKFLEMTSNDYNVPEDIVGELYFNDLVSTPSIQVDIKDVVITKVVLYNISESTGYDYVKELDPGGAISSVFSGNSGTNYCWYGWAVNDPRQNLNLGDWEYTGKDPSDDATQVLSLTGPAPYTGNPNALNTVGTKTVSPNNAFSYLDKEASDDPSDGNLSTAFIRNNVMESPWELGFIHRGYMWQTINLKTYDKDKAIKTFSLASPTRYYIPGAGEYSSGDANILDQIKMTAEAQSPAKINLRSKNSTALSTLFRKVQYNCPVDSAISTSSMTTGGTLIVEDDYRDAVKNKYPTASDDDMRTRASVVDILTTPVSIDADAVKEEIIGKIVNLTKIEQVGSDGFTIIVLAQAIKDIGTSAGISITKTSFDGSQTATRTCELGVFEADTSDADSDKHVYFDEITGVQKLKVMGVISAGEVEITSFKYID